MKLPVTTESALPSPATLWRRFSDLLFDHAVALGEEIALPFGRGVIGMSPANVMILPPEPLPAGAMDGVFAAYREQGKTPDSCVGPSSLSAEMLPNGWVNRPHRLMLLRGAAVRSETPAGVMILPARAAITHFQTLCALQGGTGSILPAHLDDSQYDALLALRDGQPIAAAALQTRGQTGFVCDVLVADKDFSSAVIATLIGRMIELAARSQLKDVFAASSPDATFYDAAGFVEIAEFGIWSAQA